MAGYSRYFFFINTQNILSTMIIFKIKYFFSSEKGTRVHFEVSFEPIFTAVSTAEVSAVMTRDILTPFFQNIGAIPATLHIEVWHYLKTTNEIKCFLSVRYYNYMRFYRKVP